MEYYICLIGLILQYLLKLKRAATEIPMIIPIDYIIFAKVMQI